jgi:GTP-binding protein
MKNKFTYIKSAVYPEDYPPADRPEIIVAGRSNAGKSSFLNALAGGPVAKVSQTPGKTRLLNFFSVGEKYRIVDTPGYGFSKRSGEEQASWQEMLEEYFSMRGTLCGVLLLMDCRREWEREEALMLSFAQRINTPAAILLTKCDKIKPPEIKKMVSAMKKNAQLEFVFPVSTQTMAGMEEIEEFYFRTWIRPILLGGKE